MRNCAVRAPRAEGKAGMIRHTVFLAAVLALPAAAQDAILPPPGLYRVDTDATILAHGGNDPPVRVQRDGAGGVTLTSGRRADGSLHRRAHPEAAQPVYCIAPNAATPPLPPLNGCTSEPGKKEGNKRKGGAMRFVAHCPGMEVTTTLRRTGPVTWEYRIRTVQAAAPTVAGRAGAAGVEPMKAMLEHAARHGATPQERAAAARELSLCDARAAAMQPAPAATPALDVTAVQTLTRIAGRCAD